MATVKQTIDKAYGSIPKEVNFTFCIDIDTWRGIKYYWYKLIRKLTR